MSWFDEIGARISEFCNHPLVKIIVSISATIVGIISIISKTELGKKALTELKNKYKTLVDYFAEFKGTKETEILTIKESYETKALELKQCYDEKLALALAKVNELQTFTTQVLELIPNEKVKQYLTNEKSKLETQIVGISDVVDGQVEIVREKYETLIAELKEHYESILADYNNELAKVNERLKQLEEGATNGKE